MNQLNGVSTFRTDPREWLWPVKFINACKDNDLEALHTLCGPEYVGVMNIHCEEEEGFRLACEKGHLEVVRFLTTSPYLKSNGHEWVDIHNRHALGFRQACAEGHLEVVKFLSTSLELKEAGYAFVDVHAQGEGAFRWACERGQMEVVRFLTLSDELTAAGHTPVDIHVNDQGALMWACMKGQREVVRWLTQSEELKAAGYTLSDIRCPKAKVLEKAWINGQLEVVQELFGEWEGAFRWKEWDKQWIISGKDKSWEWETMVRSAVRRGHREVIFWAMENYPKGFESATIQECLQGDAACVERWESLKNHQEWNRLWNKEEQEDGKRRLTPKRL